MGYEIEQQIIPGLPDIALDSTNIVVAHESGNPNNTGSDSLENEISYMSDNWKTAFTSHWVGGGGRIVKTAPTGKMQYGAGPVANKVAYAHVEMARTDNKETFKKDYKAYVWLLKQLASEAKIPQTLDTDEEKGIKSHNWVRDNLGGTTHTDPYAYFKSFGVTKEKFEKDIEGDTNAAPDVKPNKKDPSEDKSDSYNGNSIVDYLKSIDVDASKENRKKLANEYGVNGYDFSASKNMELLEAMRNGDKVSSGSNYEGGSIVDYLKGIGVDSSKANRQELANQYGVDNYDFSASKNLELLNAMRDGGKPAASYGKGDKVTINTSASNYATGESIPDKYKGSTYTVQQVDDSKVLIEELYSWVNKSDISPGSGSGASRSHSDFDVGDTVTIKKSADKYATGEAIPDGYKGVKYTIQQVESGKVLIEELYSWVNKDDIY